MTLSDLLEKTKGFTLEEIKEREAARRRRPVFLISQFASELISLAQEQAAKLKLMVSHMEASVAVEQNDCKKALYALAGAKYPTPLEGYGTNSSWAISGLSRCVGEQAAEIERLRAQLDDSYVKELRSEIERLKGGKWISVKERLPEFAGTYLIAVSGPGDDFTGTLPAEWDSGQKYWTNLRGWGQNEITHWQPLPSSPTERQEKA